MGVGGAKKNIIITPFLLVATGGGSRRRRTFKCTGIVYTNHDESEMKARIGDDGWYKSVELCEGGGGDEWFLED